MESLEQQFEQDLIRTAEQHQLVCGWNPTRFLQQVHQYGGLSVVKRMLSQGKHSESLERLAEHGRLELALETLVVQQKYASLFTDEEVNTCFDSLCQYGYYG